MISYLKGNVVLKEKGFIILNVNGVGYKIFVGEKELRDISKSEEREFFCYLRIKQDETIELYGFGSSEALRFFEVLNSISGIGPKTALVLSSLGSTQDLQKAIEQGDAKFFAGVKGIGTKKIQKIMVELTGKFSPLRKENDSGDEALDALVGLGFTKAKAKDALDKVSQDIKTPEERIKSALKLLGR